ADRVVTFLKEPIGDAARLHGPRRQLARRYHLARPTADEEIDRPGGIRGSGGREVAAQGGHFLAGLVGLVQGGVAVSKGFHSAVSSPGTSPVASSRSPSNRVGTTRASRPRSHSHRASTSE